MSIVAKVKEPAGVASATRDTGQGGSGHTYLKRVEPASFSGDILDYPESKRKWAANVHNENTL